ncbi:uncharacterized protein N7473_009292 [Penicillium subrubescens]|uniref:Uncharacterized protein n=1 Tax=Penicillium subrubescens TaxID=1316194 RepID=A0A1Q5TAR5_9EURO|nr:uncharacterized protein N7473_009292 [Penicillium subrubescens]KAJ5886618.1 hypothetical protein N7473_009292 [Penicillium subrubescens]OKO97283.1 hypothetical protein PENSUB_10077 [Penicillium subrubescens]
MSRSIANVEAALMQVVGTAEDNECIKCQEGGGQFHQCVIVCDVTTHCANCRWNGKRGRCTFELEDVPQPSDASPMPGLRANLPPHDPQPTQPNLLDGPVQQPPLPDLQVDSRPRNPRTTQSDPFVSPDEQPPLDEATSAPSVEERLMRIDRRNVRYSRRVSRVEARHSRRLDQLGQSQDSVDATLNQMQSDLTLLFQRTRSRQPRQPRRRQ